MTVYSEKQIRKRLSILRIGRIMNKLNDKGIIELTLCKILLDLIIEDKKYSINK